MKTIILSVSVIILSLTNIQETPSDFDYELSDIARDFRNEIMNEDECENLKRAADDLVDEIEEAIEMYGEYSIAEILELKKLKKEAEALEQFIAAVGDCGNYIPSIEEFNLANQRVRARVSYVSKNKYCVDMILVEIGDYVAYLAENNSSKNYTVSYKWKVTNGMSTGNGTMGLSKYSVRHIYNNRDEIAQKNISIFGVNCKEF